MPSLFLIYQNRLSEEVLSCKNIVTTENTLLFIYFYFSSKRPETQMGHNVLWQGKVMVSAWGGRGQIVGYNFICCLKKDPKEKVTLPAWSLSES